MTRNPYDVLGVVSQHRRPTPSHRVGPIAAEAQEVATTLREEHGIDVTPRTVHMDITSPDRLGLVFKESREVPAKARPDERLAFAKAQLKLIDEHVAKHGAPPFYVFGDETWCNATHRVKGKYCKPDDPRPVVKCKERFVPKVNTFGVLTEKRLHAWDMPDGQGKRGGVVGAQFVKFFMAKVGPLVCNIKKQAKGRDIVVVLDGAGIHMKGQTAKWCEKHSLTLMEKWPAHSPDLNPIENAWAHMKTAIGKELQIYDTKNIEESRRRISRKRDAVVKNYRQESCENLVESFRRRLMKCVERGGEHTGY